MKHRKSGLTRVIALMLVCALALPCLVSAASAAPAQTAQPYGSIYLSAYNSYICPMGGGKLEIWFTVVGTGEMDELGTLSILLYESTDKENWTWKKTFLHDSWASMLSYNDGFHSDYVSYQGVAGRYYKAYVCVWAGKDGDGDTRYFWTGPEQAT